MLENQKLGAKLSLGFGMIVLVALIIGGVALYNTGRLGQDIEEIGNNRMPSVAVLLKVKVSMYAINSGENALLSTKISTEDMKDAFDRMSRNVEMAEAAWKIGEQLPTTTEEDKVIAAFMPAWQAWMADHLKYQALAKAYWDAKERTETAYLEMSNQALTENVKTFEIAQPLLDKLIELNEGYGATAVADSFKAIVAAKIMIWSAIIAGVILAIILSILITRSITRPVTVMCETLVRVANGDLTRSAAITQKDEIGQMAGTLNSTVTGMRSLIGGISQNAQGIAGAAEELSAVSKQLTGNAETSANQSSLAATAATEISASISTFAAGVEEMGVTVSEIAKSASQAASVAHEGVAAAEDANTVMTRLGTSSNEIGDIVKVITSIAEQTNLLALNATIEAARAGDAGRGFAVVASEVKDLALKTSEATADIGKRVSGIQGDSKAAQAALSRITDIVGKINDLQQTIATAVEEQSATNKELAGNIGQVAQAGSEISANVNAVAGAAKETAAGAGETLKAANELAKLAADLRQAVARFRT